MPRAGRRRRLLRSGAISPTALKRIFALPFSLLYKKLTDIWAPGRLVVSAVGASASQGETPGAHQSHLPHCSTEARRVGKEMYCRCDIRVLSMQKNKKL